MRDDVLSQMLPNAGRSRAHGVHRKQLHGRQLKPRLDICHGDDNWLQHSGAMTHRPVSF